MLISFTEANIPKSQNNQIKELQWSGRAGAITRARAPSFAHTQNSSDENSKMQI